MNINATYSQSFVEQARRDLKEIEDKAVSKLETLDDLKDTKGKSFRTSDIEKLMEKYDPKSYERYKNMAFKPDGGRTSSGLSYLSKWMDNTKKGLVQESPKDERINDISAKNEEKLSHKAQEFLKNLRGKYGDYDFMIGNGSDELMSLSKSGSKEYSVIFSSAEIERMANDEKYAEEKMQGVAGAVRMAKKVAEEYGFGSATDGFAGKNGIINKIGVVVNDDGSMKMFAELEKSSTKQRERIEANKEKKAEEKKNLEKTKGKNPYDILDKNSVKRATIEAESEEELIKKLKEFDWSQVNNSFSGDRFNFTA